MNDEKKPLTMKFLSDEIELLKDEIEVLKRQINAFSMREQNIEKTSKKVVILHDEPITIKAKKHE
jgi:cell division septum initiation protein DivIVA